jgi:IclR family pca regulon transcriptional regulator
MRALAVPVIDSRGRVQAAVSVSSLAARVSPEALRNDFYPVLRRAADAIGRRL